MKIDKLLIKIIKITMVSILVTNASAMNLEQQQGLHADGFLTKKPVIPLKIYTISKEYGIIVKGVRTVHEIWEMELPAIEDDELALYLPSVFSGESKYKDIKFYIEASYSIQLIGKEKIDSKVIKDSSGEQRIVESIYFMLPASTDSRRARIEYAREETTLEDPIDLQLPNNIPVERAALAIDILSSQSEKVVAEATDFVTKKLDGNSGQTRITYTLKTGWTPTANSKIPAPAVRVSFTSWHQVAELHGKYYLQGLENKLNQLPKFDFHLPDKKRPLDSSQIRASAYQVFRWIGENFYYRDPGLIFNIEKKNMPRTLGAIISTQSGDCKDLTLLYLYLLSSIGIKAEPVLVKINEFGATTVSTKLPAVYAFNHVIVYIPAIDEYIDPTSSKDYTRFSVASGEFSNSYGLHLFSKKLQRIKPDLVQGEMSINTTISQIDGNWIGTTKLVGRKSAMQTLVLIQKYREKFIANGTGTAAPFNKLSFAEIPDSRWYEYDDMNGVGTLSFSFNLLKPPVDDAGRLIYIPEAVSHSILFSIRPETSLSKSTNDCFGSEISNENIKLFGVKSSRLPDSLLALTLTSENRHYTQSVVVNGDGLHLTRKYQLNEAKEICSDAEIESRDRILKEIDAVYKTTHAVRDIER